MPEARGRSAGALGRRDRQADGRRRARQGHVVTRCVMCHTIGGIGADFGPALDGWGRGKSAEVIATAIVRPERRDRAGLRRHGNQDQGRADHPGRAAQGRRSADDAQHGRRHADHSRPIASAPAPADVGVADDERARSSGSPPRTSPTWWRSCGETERRCLRPTDPAEAACQEL